MTVLRITTTLEHIHSCTPKISVVTILHSHRQVTTITRASTTPIVITTAHGTEIVITAASTQILGMGAIMDIIMVTLATGRLDTKFAIELM